MRERSWAIVWRCLLWRSDTDERSPRADSRPGAPRSGILAAGSFIVDRVIVIDRYPAENMLASIDAETLSSGGCAYSVLKDLAILGAAFPLTAAGALGADANGDWVLADCAPYGIDVSRLVRVADVPTSYTYAMTVRTTGRRTFFHRRGANALLAPQHFDFTSVAARIFMLGYLTLLDALDTWTEPGQTGAADVLRRAREAGLMTAADLVSAPHPRYRAIVAAALPHVDHLLCNELEAAMVLDRQVSATPDDLLDAARELAALGVNASVVIHCEAGAVAVDCASREAATQAAVALPGALVAGATGAGDAFSAGYLMALHAGAPPAQRLHAGVCCAAAALRDASASGGLEPLEACLQLGARFGFRTFANVPA